MPNFVPTSGGFASLRSACAPPSFNLLLIAWRLHVLLRFRVGVHGLPDNVGRQRGVAQS